MFDNNPLQMLDEIKTVSESGIDLDEITKRAIYDRAQSILSVKKYLWFKVLSKILMGNYVALALEALLQTRLMGYVLPELFPITLKPPKQNVASKDLWRHTKIVVTQSKRDIVIRWAALLHDIAKPQTQWESGNDIHFYQHEYLGAELVDSIAKRLKMPTDIYKSVRGLVSLHQRISDIVSRKNDPPVSMNALRRLTRDCEDRYCRIEDLVELFAADCSSGRTDVLERQAAHANLLREAIRTMREEDARPRLPKGTGEILMSRYKLEPGPQVGRLMEDLNRLLQEGEITVESSVEEMLSKLEQNMKEKI